MKALGWAYIAGFTDGDGCITTRTRVNTTRPNAVDYRISWSQKEDNDWVLDEIQSFLEARGMSVYRNTRNTGFHGAPQTQILIQRKLDVRLALIRMLPYLIVKKAAALDALEIINRPVQNQAALKRVRT